MKIFALLKRYCSFVILILGGAFWGMSTYLLGGKGSKYTHLQKDQAELINKIRKIQQQKIETHKREEKFQKFQKAGFLETTTVEDLKIILGKLVRKNFIKSLTYIVKAPQKKQIQKTMTFWYKVVLDIEHPQDQEIFKIIEQLPYYFPGIIVPEQILLTRVDDTSAKSSENSRVSGQYQFYVVTFESVPELDP